MQQDINISNRALRGSAGLYASHAHADTDVFAYLWMKWFSSRYWHPQAMSRATWSKSSMEREEGWFYQKTRDKRGLRARTWHDSSLIQRWEVSNKWRSSDVNKQRDYKNAQECSYPWTMQKCAGTMSYKSQGQNQNSWIRLSSSTGMPCKNFPQFSWETLLNFQPDFWDL